MQQPDSTLIYSTPSRVRFNLTLILAGVVVALGLLQMVGIDPLSAVCNPRNTSEPTATTEGTPAETGSQSQTTSTNRSGAMLLVLVGLGVGAYSWLTSPRAYHVYGDALVIAFGTPRRRTIHFSDIREVVLDRGFMGDPLRVYTVNRRRVPLQVREPEEAHRWLDQAVKDFWRDNPQYAPAASPEDDDDVAANVVDSTVADATVADSSDAGSEAPPEPRADGSAADAAEEPPRRSPRSRRRSLRDDADYDASDDDSRPRFS